MNTILITGSAGFIGKQLLQQLILLDIPIILILRNNSDVPNHKNIKKIIRTNDLFNESIEWWESSLTGVDCIINLAWYAEPHDYLGSEKNIECFLGAYKMGVAAKNKKIKKFIGIGSCNEYEHSGTSLSIDSPLNPNTLYGLCKKHTYLSLNQLFTDSTTKFIWCRLFNIYGDGERAGRLYPYVIECLDNNREAVINNPNYIRDYLEVAEVARRIIKQIKQENSGAVNICSGKGVSIKNFVDEIARKYNKNSLIKYSETTSGLSESYVVGVN